MAVEVHPVMEIPLQEKADEHKMQVEIPLFQEKADEDNIQAQEKADNIFFDCSGVAVINAFLAGLSLVTGGGDFLRTIIHP
jgi:hypothetical protein